MNLRACQVVDVADGKVQALGRDKKSRNGRVPFVLAPEIGHFTVVFDVPGDIDLAVGYYPALSLRNFRQRRLALAGALDGGL